MANGEWQMARTEGPRPKINSTSSVSAGGSKIMGGWGWRWGCCIEKQTKKKKKRARLYTYMLQSQMHLGFHGSTDGFCLPSAIYASVKCQVLKLEFGLADTSLHILTLTHIYTYIVILTKP